MDYSKFFNSELEKLKKEGLYRKFREIDRPIKKFPKADETQGEIERDVEVWCSNDYLNMSQHPEVVNETIQDWISIPKIKRDFDEAIGQKGIAEIIEYQQKNRSSLINGAKLIYENWLNLIKKK